MPLALVVLILGLLYFADKHGKLKTALWCAGAFIVLYVLGHL
jgi:hypothetical protein